MNTPKFLLDEEKAKQFFKYSVVFASGSIVTSLLSIRSLRKFNRQAKARKEMVEKYREDIRRIQDDVTLSGSEREKQIDTILEFVRLILNQPFD